MKSKYKISVFILTFILCTSFKIVDKPTKEILLSFNNANSFIADTLKTLNSLRTVEEIFTLSYYGDYDEILKQENQKLKNYAKTDCSIFFIENDSCKLFGRNLDLQFKLENILVGKYCPPKS